MKRTFLQQQEEDITECIHCFNLEPWLQNFPYFFIFVALLQMPEQLSPHSDYVMGWAIRGLNPGRKEVSFFSKTSRRSLGPTHLPVQWYRDSFPQGDQGVKPATHPHSH
jgi:hypothetical protein